MMKEIHEQPKAVQDTLNSVIKNGAIDLSSVEITEDEIKNFEQIYIVACGSAWHVGMAAQYVLERYSGYPSACGTRIRVPLSEDAAQSEGTCNRCQPVWRDSRYIGCTATCKRKRHNHNGNRQCGRQQYCP